MLYWARTTCFFFAVMRFKFTTLKCYVLYAKFWLHLRDVCYFISFKLFCIMMTCSLFFLWRKNSCTQVSLLFDSVIVSWKVEDAILEFKDMHQKLEVSPSSSAFEQLIKYTCDLKEVTLFSLFAENLLSLLRILFLFSPFP